MIRGRALKLRKEMKHLKKIMKLQVVNEIDKMTIDHKHK
jgi:hypothetical protein